MTEPGANRWSSAFQRRVQSVDRFQQAHAPFAFAYGVTKKFGDDRGSQLGGLIAFYGFLSFFPLMLVLVTLTAFLAHGNPHRSHGAPGQHVTTVFE